MKLKGKRIKVPRMIRRGDFVVAVEIEAVYPIDDPSEPCYEAETVQFLKEVAEHAEKGDIAWLKQHGTVFKCMNETVTRKHRRRVSQKTTGRRGKTVLKKSRMVQ